MDALINDPKAWLIALVTGYVMVLSWIGQKYIRRIERLEDRLMPRGEFEKAFADMKEQRITMHAENKEGLNEIKQQLRDINTSGVLVTRIDNIEARLKEVVDWKHKVDPFIERKVLP